MAEAQKKLIMNVDVDSLWAEITDYESYADFIEGVESVTVLSRKKNIAHVEYTINRFKRFTYQLKHTETPNKKLTWEMTDGEFFKSNSGSWVIKELAPSKLEVKYTVKVDMPRLVPKKIVDIAVTSNLPAMLEAFEDRAYNRMKKGKKSTVKSTKKKTTKKATKKSTTTKKK